jgi:uncharacterized protein (TIGR03067 family)
MRSTALLISIFLFLSPGFGQEVQNTSYTTSTGERVLRLEVSVPMGHKQAWKLFSTEKGLKMWIAPVVSLNFKVGGEIVTNYDTTKSAGDPGLIRLPIINYVEGELVTLKVNLNSSFAEKVRQEDRNLQEIIQIVDLGGGRTKISSSMLGWGSGPEWDKAYEFFRRGNEWTFKQMITAIQGESPTMDGIWMALDAELSGKKFPKEVVATIRLILKNGTYSLQNDRGEFKTDQSTTPFSMDIVGLEGPNKGKTIPAIYKLTEDTLTICYGLQGASRPTKFQTAEGTQFFLVHYKRSGG